MGGIVLGGVKHCGKTTLGELLSANTGLPFIDTDTVIAAGYQDSYGAAATVREIFARHGEEFFRELEAAVIADLAAATEVRIVALGGGATENPGVSTALLRKLGFGVYLNVAPELAFRRIVAGGLPPFLADAADPAAAFRSLWERRDRSCRAFAELVFDIPAERPAIELAAKLQARLVSLGVLS